MHGMYYIKISVELVN